LFVLNCLAGGFVQGKRTRGEDGTDQIVDLQAIPHRIEQILQAMLDSEPLVMEPI